MWPRLFQAKAGVVSASARQSEPSSATVFLSLCKCVSVEGDLMSSIEFYAVRTRWWGISSGFALAALASVALAAPPVCHRTGSAEPAMANLRATMATGRFITYQPTSLQVVNGHPTHADPSSIRADLKVLRPRFDALITYGAVDGAEAIPAIAASLGYRAVIIGVWNPFDQHEMDAAIAAAKSHPALVAGLSLGNEMVYTKRRSFAEAAAVMAAVRRQIPRTPISATEPFHLFYEPAASAMLAQMDFLLANVHPIFQPWFRDAPDGNAAQFVVNVVSKLTESYCGPIVVKEVGVPTAPESAGLTSTRQAAFFRELQRQFPSSATRAFSYFSAFDAPWRVQDAQAAPGVHPEEAHWGLYDESRRPKPVIQQIPPLKPSAG
jgi:exo-beta-1,3-glucanase (GH17 family)